MLTQAQASTLRTHIQANTTQLAFGGGTAAINDTFNAPFLSGGDALVIAQWYSQIATPDFFVWRDLPMEEVLNLIQFASMTPSDPVPASPALDVSVWTARALSCQGKQFNLQNLIMGRQFAPMRRGNYRAALQDCLTQLPAGSSGANIAANWNGVRDAAKFLARNVEKLFAVGSGTSGNPADLTYDGSVGGEEIAGLK